MSKALSILSKDSRPILLQLSRNVPARAAETRLKFCRLVFPSAEKSHKHGLVIYNDSEAKRKFY